MPRTLFIQAKCSDLCFATYENTETGLVIEHNGYVPDLDNIGGGDCVELEIDLDTGQILNWKPISEEEVKEAIDNA